MSALESTRGERTPEFLRAMERDFPGFAVVHKRNDRLQRAIHWALVIVTFGGQRSYITRYHTVLFGKLWVPDSYDSMNDLDRYVLLRHERVHLEQRVRMGDVKMALVYLVWFFPLFLAYGRARIEWEAYVETIRATAEVYDLERARALKSHIVERFVGPDYGWMWPFRKQVEAWFDATIAELSVKR